MSEIEKISWAPKVVRARVWQLYQNDALGAIDEALVVDVGFSLWLRCKSIVMVTLFQVECPRCRRIFDVGRMEGTESIECPTSNCGWQVTGEQYHASWRHRDLLGSRALTAFQTYVEGYPRAGSSAERMFCIDRLIHAFHWDLKENAPNRSTAGNLIEGSHTQVVAFLDRLSFGESGIDKEHWRETVDAMMRRRRGGTPAT
jgi:hypothetical protein